MDIIETEKEKQDKEKRIKEVESVLKKNKDYKDKLDLLEKSENIEFQKISFEEESRKVEELVKQYLLIEENEKYLQMLRIKNDFDVEKFITEVKENEQLEMMSEFKNRNNSKWIDFRLLKYQQIEEFSRISYKKTREILDSQIKIKVNNGNHFNLGPKLTNFK